MARKKTTIFVSEEKLHGGTGVSEFHYQGTTDDHPAWNPPMDIYETDKDLVILLDAAGLDEDSLKLHAVGDRLVINGERSFQQSDSIQRYHQLEISFMPFQKTLVMPGSIEITSVDAEYSRGMLHIRIPKTTLRKAKGSHE